MATTDQKTGQKTDQKTGQKLGKPSAKGQRQSSGSRLAKAGSSGWKWLIASVAVAIILSLWFRFSFSPEKVAARLNAEFSRKGIAAETLVFGTTKISLARGVLPQIALIVDRFEYRPLKACESTHGPAELAIKAEHIEVPLALASLFESHWRIGKIRGASLEVDLDALKRHCTSTLNPAVAVASDTVSDTSPSETSGRAEDLAPELEKFRAAVEGADIRGLQLIFEKKTKKVYFEALELINDRKASESRLNARIQLPASMTLGQTLPIIQLQGALAKTTAWVAGRTAVAEGLIELRADLKDPFTKKSVVKANANLKNLPLSSLAPLLQTAKVTGAKFADANFKPRFFWLDCDVSIQGAVARLFETEELVMRDCNLKGNGSSIRFKEAVREPTGEWRDFHVEIQKLEIRQLLETFSWEGPEGIMSDFGRVSGVVDVKRGAHQTLFNGRLEGAKLHFSNRTLRAEQILESVETQLQFNAGSVSGKLNKFNLSGGNLEGEVSFNFDVQNRDGRVELNLEKLNLDQPVETLLTGGGWDSVVGRAEGKIENSKLTSFDGEFTINNLEAETFRVDRGSVSTSMARDREIRLTFRAADVGLNTASSLYRAASTAIETALSDIGDRWLPLKNVSLKASFAREGGISWQALEAYSPLSRQRLFSEGSLSRDRVLTGRLRTEGRGRKKEWDWSGYWNSPTLAPTAP